MLHIRETEGFGGCRRRLGGLYSDDAGGFTADGDGSLAPQAPCPQGCARVTDVDCAGAISPVSSAFSFLKLLLSLPVLVHRYSQYLLLHSIN